MSNAVATCQSTEAMRFWESASTLPRSSLRFLLTIARVGR